MQHLMTLNASKPIKLDLDIAIYINRPSVTPGKDRQEEIHPSLAATKDQIFSKPKLSNDNLYTLAPHRRTQLASNPVGFSTEMVKNETATVKTENTSGRKLSILASTEKHIQAKNKPDRR